VKHEIRKATLADLDKIAAVEAACFPRAEAATTEEFRERLTAYPDHFWLMENENQQLISFVNGMTTDHRMLTDEMYEDTRMHDESGAWQMIFGVNTVPEYRKQGCAGRILNTVIRESREQGRAGVVLTCKEKLIHYYASFGFIDEGISDSVHGGAVWHDMRLSF
jgi:predicted GNAT family N-acyltransferase